MNDFWKSDSTAIIYDVIYLARVTTREQLIAHIILLPLKPFKVYGKIAHIIWLSNMMNSSKIFIKRL